MAMCNRLPADAAEILFQYRREKTPGIVGIVGIIRIVLSHERCDITRGVTADYLLFRRDAGVIPD